MNIQKARIKARQILYIQTAVMVLIAVLSGFFLSTQAAYSALLGGMIYLASAWFFAECAFKYAGARKARQIVRAFYGGELGKLLLTIVLFVLVLTTITINAPVFLGTYIVLHCVFWLAPWVFK